MLNKPGLQSPCASGKEPNGFHMRNVFSNIVENGADCCYAFDFAFLKLVNHATTCRGVLLDETAFIEHIL